MKFWQLPSVALACLAAVGCCTKTAQSIALLERENRQLEDKIYRLQWQLEDCREAAGRTSGKRDGGPLDFMLPAAGADEPAAQRDEAPPFGGSGVDIKLPLKEVSPDEALAPLMGNPKPTDDPRITPDVDPPARAAPPADDRLPWPDSGELPGGPSFYRPDVHGAPPASTDSTQVDRIDVRQQLAGGFDADGRPGDDGITLVVAPRTADGRPLDAAGKMAVVVLDPAYDDESARVARWDLTAADVARASRAGGSEGGFRLQLPWTAAPPTHGDLYVFVRYFTSDGRRLHAEGPIHVALAGDPASGWTRSETPRQTNPHAELQQADTLPPARVGSLPERRQTVPPPAPTIRRPVWSPNRPS